MQSLLVVANLGKIRIFKYKKGGEDPREQDHLVEEAAPEIGTGPGTRGEAVTDQSGRFAQGASPGMGGGMSYGEEHNLDSELERKSIEQVATAIGGAVAAHGNPSWALVAPQPILARLQEALPKAAREALDRTEGSDLTKTPVAKLEERFLAG